MSAPLPWPFLNLTEKTGEVALRSEVVRVTELRRVKDSEITRRVVPAAEICGPGALLPKRGCFLFPSRSPGPAVPGTHFSFPGQSRLLALGRTGLALGDDVWHLSVPPG